MKAYIVIEWNGETYEDADYTNVAVYLNKELAENHINIFNASRDIQPIPPPIDNFTPMWEGQSYEIYCETIEHNWEYYDRQKKQHIQEIEITE